MSAEADGPAWNTPVDLLISDMDGTLVTPDKQLTPRAIEAAQALQAAGIKLSLISARPPRGMIPYAQRLAIPGPIAAFNGGNLMDTDGKLVEARRLDADLARAAIALILKRGAAPWVFADDTWRLCDITVPKIARERLAVGFDPILVDSFEDVIDRVDKLVGVSDDHPLLEALEIEAQGLWGDRATILRSQTYYLDFTHSQANKGDGVAALAQTLGVPLARTAVIGDMYNDLAMFRVAGLAIAMGQAPDAVKAEAHVLTGPNTEDGFAKAVERLTGLRQARQAGA